jgi:hypothetical protein
VCIAPQHQLYTNALILLFVLHRTALPYSAAKIQLAKFTKYGKSDVARYLLGFQMPRIDGIRNLIEFSVYTSAPQRQIAGELANECHLLMDMQEN